MKAEQSSSPTQALDDATDLAGPDGSVGVASPIQGTIVAINVNEGDAVRQGQQVAVVEAMKMEHVIAAPHAGIVRSITMPAGDVVREGFPIVFVKEAEVAGGAVAAARARSRPHPRRPAREHRAPRADAGRKPPRGCRTAAQDRPQDAARKHRAAGRSRLVQRVLAADGGAAAPAQLAGGAPQEHAGRRRRRRHVLDQRPPVRRDALARGAGALRLHRARRHARPAQPLQAGPDVRAGASFPPADDHVRRGRRRPARRG